MVADVVPMCTGQNIFYGTKNDGTPGKPGDVGNYEIYKIGEDDCKGGSLPGQGSLFNTPDDRWFWIGQFNLGSAAGRTPVLLPVTWISDFPVIGTDIKGQHGKMKWQLSKPISGKPISLPQGNDEFNKDILNPQWQWNYQPHAGKWSLKQRKGYLRLYAFNQVEQGKFFKTANVLCQRYLQSDSITITTSLDLTNMANGQESGLAHFHDKQDYATIAVVLNNGEKRLKYEENNKVGEAIILPDNKLQIWFRSSVGYKGISHYQYSLDGKNFIAFGGAYVLKQGNHGDMIGLYTFNNEADAGYIDVDWFHYNINNK